MRKQRETSYRLCLNDFYFYFKEKKSCTEPEECWLLASSHIYILSMCASKYITHTGGGGEPPHLYSLFSCWFLVSFHYNVVKYVKLFQIFIFLNTWIKAHMWYISCNMLWRIYILQLNVCRYLLISFHLWYSLSLKFLVLFCYLSKRLLYYRSWSIILIWTQLSLYVQQYLLYETQYINILC